jgi:hypothetical protein
MKHAVILLRGIYDRTEVDLTRADTRMKLLALPEHTIRKR